MRTKSLRESLCVVISYADKRLRPFLRRRTKMARPVRVPERFINPCARTRFRFFG